MLKTKTYKILISSCGTAGRGVPFDGLILTCCCGVPGVGAPLGGITRRAMRGTTTNGWCVIS